MDREEVTVKSSVVGWVLILFQLAIGFVSIAFAVDEGFAEGKVVFDHEAWRIVLGAAGAYLAFRAARAIVRTINRAPVELGPEQRRRSKRHGWIMWIIGAAFLFAALNRPYAERSVRFTAWAKPAAVVSGVYLVLMGAVARMDGYAMRQAQRARVERGETIAPYLSSDE